ncbi:MAG: hypothetical protein QOD57_3757 [Actinomycetota bacterium]|nr:hypothetical protein [Actinomycetota bacterium]
MTDGLGLWVYGVVEGKAAGPATRPGVDCDYNVELIRSAGLAVVVSPVPLDAFGERSLPEALEDLDRLETLARVHNDVLREALEHGPVVPFRICTIYAGAARVKDMLVRQHVHLTAVLQRLQGMAEWGVKAYVVGGPGGETAAAGPASGTEYLRRRRAERDASAMAQQTLDAALDGLHGRLRQRAADAVLNPPPPRDLWSAGQGEIVLNAAYLVADGDVDGFCALVADLAGRHRSDGVELELTGPWPAYHFSEAVVR